MRILCFVEFFLDIKNYDVIYAQNENDFYEKVLNKKYDVIIVSFLYFSKYLEIKRYVNSTVIFLTEYCDIQIYKKALQTGDYCYQYTELDKLVYRLDYLRKKILNLQTAVYKSGDILYNFNTNELFVSSKPVFLSSAENELLKALIKRRNSYISKEDILMECESIESEDSVKVLISHIRKAGINIENKKNLGYKIKE